MKTPEELGIYQGGALSLSHAQLALKQLTLNQLSDAGGHKMSGCPTLAETDSLGCFSIKKGNMV